MLVKYKMLPGSAATHWNYGIFCAYGLSWSEIFQDFSKVHSEDFLPFLYCLWPLQQ